MSDAVPERPARNYSAGALCTNPTRPTEITYIVLDWPPRPTVHLLTLLIKCAYFLALLLS
jgi:hypothetical protein